MGVENNHIHFQWCAVFAGSIVALAVTLVLTQFGSVIGLSSDGKLFDDINLVQWAVIATGIWILWVQLIAAVLGGYISGRTRSRIAEFTPHENELRDGLYGLVTWALSTFVIFIIVSVGVGFGLVLDALNNDSNTTQAIVTLTEKEQNAAIISAFVLGSTSLVSAVASWWAATLGGDHRDKGTDYSKNIAFKCCK